MSRTLARILVLGALALVLVAGSACGGSNTTTGTGGSTTTAGGASVEIKDFAFTPSSVEIAVGDSVTWTNNDPATHTVTGDGGIDSGDLAQGQTYSHPFDAAGTYSYKCSIHPNMTGTVTVK